MVERKFKTGQRVRAKWPGSSLYFEGQIEDWNDIEYLVKFDDPEESKLAIKYKDVAARDTFTRSRSRSRGRSPSRKTKSPARASSKSPARAGMSPARAGMSPARAVKSRASAASKSPGRRVTTKTATTKTATTKLDSSINSNKGNKSPSRGINRLVNSSASSAFSFNSRSSNEETNQLTTTTTSTSTLATLSQNARLASLDESNDVKASGSSLASRTSSDSSSGMTRVKAFFKSVWSVVLPVLTTAPLIVMIAAAPLYFTIACTKTKCTLLELPQLSRKVAHYYDVQAIGIVFGLLALHLVLSFIPIRTRVLPNGAKARTNGVVMLVVSCALFLLGRYYFLLDVTRPYLLLRPLITTHSVLAIIMGVLLYIKSYYAPRSQRNPRTVGHFLPDFVEGREVNPRIGRLDLKSFLFKHVIVCSMLLLLVMVFREFQISSTPSKSGDKDSLQLPEYNVEFFVLAGLQLFYLLDMLVFEESFFTTWEYTRQGCGYLIAGFYLAMPYVFILNSRVVVNFRTPLPWYYLCGLVVMFLVGYILQRGSNNQKHSFRTNPSSPSVAHLESLPTSAGTRLLVSGWWSVVRHPNYLGDMIVQLSLCLFCGFQYALPWLSFALSFASLIHRIYENERSCARKYGLSWNTYTGRVKYRLVPKVF
ncbi:Ergosterol biosynthesis ERG4/ERG24 [Trinorchestia longiramus]|nr:Ergosterol biosynthesis ERG4/ERG24 [Trinorchestia longiramus]